MKSPNVVTTLHRKCRQLERSDPALRALVQRSDVRGSEVEAHGSVEVTRGLLRGETQIGRPHLDQIATCSQPCKGNGRVRPTSDQHIQVRRRVVDQELDRVMDLAALDEVVVVKDEHDIVSKPSHFVEKRCQQDRDRRRLRRGKQGHRALADSGCHGAEGRDHIGPEAARLVVAPIERQPGRKGRIPRAGTLAQPLSQQGCLAESSRCRNKDQLGRDSPVETLRKARPRDRACSRPRQVKFCLKQRSWHDPLPFAYASCCGFFCFRDPAPAESD